jgi:hypothetical protein
VRIHLDDGPVLVHAVAALYEGHRIRLPGSSVMRSDAGPRRDSRCGTPPFFVAVAPRAGVHGRLRSALAGAALAAQPVEGSWRPNVPARAITINIDIIVAALLLARRVGGR